MNEAAINPKHIAEIKTKSRRFNWPRIFGYDFFISFKLGPPPIGAQSYASDLARRLRELDFTVFFSEEEAPPGAQLDTTLVKALHRSRILVVIANEGALVQSQWVRKEVEEFRHKHPGRPVIPINVGGAIERHGPTAETSRWLDPDGSIWLDETGQAIEEGITSQEVIKRLEVAPRFMKANTRLRWVLGIIILGLVTLTTLAVWQWLEAENQARIATAQKLAAQARVHFDSKPDLAFLLSNEASLLDDSVEVRASLLDSFEHDPRLQLFLRGHTAPVQCVTFSRDGKFMATGGNDHMILLWNAQTWQLLGTFPEGHEGAVFSLAFSPDSTLLASGSTDQTVRLWDIATRKPVSQPLTGHTGSVRSVVFHPNGKTLFSSSATESEENETLQWDLSSLPPTKKIGDGFENMAGNLASSPNGQLLAIGRGQTSISLWDFQMHSQRRKQLETSGVFIQSLAFSSDSKTLAASDDNGIVLWNLDGTKPKLQELDNNVDFIQALAISPDGKLLAGGGNDAAVHLWDLATHKQIPRPLLGHRGYITSLAFHPEGGTLVSGSEDGTLIVWSLIPQWSEDGTFGKWSTISPVRHLLRNTGGVRSAAFSPDDHWLVTDGAEGTILVWDLKSGVLTPTRSIPTGRRVTNLAFATNGNSVVACHDDAHVRLWDIHVEQPRETVLSNVRCGSFAKNSSKVFDFDEVPSADGGSNKVGSLTVWEIPSGRVRLQSARLSLIAEFAVESTALSPDGKHFAVGMSNGMALLWDLRTNPPSRRELSGHNGPVTAVAFSPDSSLLASGGHDTTIRLWNVANGELQRPPMEEGDRIDYLAFNSTGTTLAVLYSRWSQGLSALHFWEVQTGKSLGSPLKGTDQHTIRDIVTFSPTGQWVITGGGEPMLWDMDLESWRTQACRRANRNLQPTEEWPLYMGKEPYRKTCPELPLPLSIPRVIHAVEDELF